MYELKEYLNAINHTKKNVMDSEDTMWVKKYPAFIVNKVLSEKPDRTLLTINAGYFLTHIVSSESITFFFV